MKRIVKWLRVVYLAPFLLMMAVDGEGGVPAPTAEELERQAAEARGDIFTPPEEGNGTVLDAVDDPEILALLANEEGEPGGKTNEPSPEDEKKGGAVPLARLNEVLEQNKALRAEVESLKGGKQDPAQAAEPAPDPLEEARKDLREVRTQHRAALADAVLDPQDEAAQTLVAELEEKLEGLQDRISDLKVDRRLESRTVQEKVQQTVAELVAESNNTYPFLDPKHETADPKAIRAIIAYREQLVVEGLPFAEALRQAVEDLAPDLAKARGLTTPAVDPNKAAEVRAAREKAARERSAAASLAQPASLPGKGERESFTLDVSKLSKKQIDALPEETKARLRGDAL